MNAQPTPKFSVDLGPDHYRQRLDGIRTYLVGQRLKSRTEAA